MSLEMERIHVDVPKKTKKKIMIKAVKSDKKVSDVLRALLDKWLNGEVEL